MQRANRLCSRLPRILTGILLGALGTSSTIKGAEVPFVNGTFDTSSAWYWEDWSNDNPARPDDVVTFDSTRDAAGSTTSGSLRVESNFIQHDGWQESVFTIALPSATDVNELYGTLSFDVLVDPLSTSSGDGDYGDLQVILRNGSNWDWKQQFPWVSLNAFEWQRIHIPLGLGDAGGAPEEPIDAVNAVTIRLAGGTMFGPVMFNIDNIAWNEGVVIENADNGLEDGLPPTGWNWETWSQPNSTVTWDDLDADGNPNSGSIRLENAFENSPNVYSQAVYAFALPGGEVNAGEEYSHINLDVKVDPASTPRPDGDYGYFEIILVDGDGWTWIPTGPATETGVRLTTTDWTHISMPIRSGSEVHRVILKLGENSFAGPIALNVDNITWTRSTVPPPPPSLEITEAGGGLILKATSTDQYGRHNIYSADGMVGGWYDVGEPMSFSFTVADYPDAVEHTAFQTHLFLVPGFPGTATSPDWNEPNLIFLDLKQNADGTANAVFRWKTNAPGGHAGVYVDGLSNVTSSTVLGTWDLTALDNTTFKVTAPDGNSTEVSLDPEAAALFAGPIRAYLGVQPNGNGNIGQQARFSNFTIKQGETVLLEDDFTTGPLDESKWVANSPAGGVQILSSEEAGYYLTWSLPDSGYVVEATGSLDDPATWTALELTPYGLGALKRQVHVPGTSLPEGDAAFFRMVRPNP